jgi:hypothetical protein
MNQNLSESETSLSSNKYSSFTESSDDEII